MAKKIKIICRAPGMRRCNAEHPAEQVYDEDHWSKEDLAIFEADRDFEVVEIDEEGSDEKDGEQPRSKAGSKGGDRPEGEELHAAIMEAVKALGEDEKPGVKLIGEKLGYKVSGEELNAAMKELKGSE